MSVEDVITQAKSRIEGLVEPVNGGVGEDVSYDELFDAMKVELDKLTAVDGGKPDWKSVAGNAEELLREKSKDFRVGLNYAAAAACSGGMTGVLDGIVLMQELTTRYWDTMYPALKRPRTRGNAVGWYSDTIGPSVAAIVVTDGQRDHCLAIDQLTRALDIEWRDKLGEAYSGMSALREQVRNLVARAPAPPPPPPPPAPPKPEPAPGAPAAAAPASARAADGQTAQAVTTLELPAGPPGPTPDSIEDLDSALKITGELGPLFDKAANVLFQADATNPNGYLFCQLGAWLSVTEDPSNNGGNTFYGAPFPQVGSGLTDLHGAADWSALLTSAQEAVMQSPIWLDAVRYMVTALENLGDDYARARTVVVHGLVSLLARAPGLVEMNFTDGTPLANDETKQWITGLAAGGGGGGGGAGSNPIDKAISQAKQTASEGDLQAAMTQLSKAVAQATTPVQKFKGRLALAKMCVEQNLNDIALAQLEGLEKVAEHHRLIDWEPALATDLYVSLYSVRRTSTDQTDPEQRAKLATAFERLCQLDAGQALKVFQS